MAKGSLSIRLSAGVFLAIASPAFADFPAIEPGVVHSKVPCVDAPGTTYALYIPRSAAPAQPLPIVYVFDSRGIATGRPMIELFLEGAERYAFVIAEANQSANTIPPAENLAHLRAMWNDTRTRIAIDERRVHGFAFSGMTRFLISAALAAPGSFAGIIAASGGYPLGTAPSRDAPLPLYALVGERDFNYYEMLDLDTRLEKVGHPKRLEIVDGSHQWPAPEEVTRSLAWMALHEMRRGTRRRDAALLSALLATEIARVASLREERGPWLAARLASATRQDFAGLVEESDFTPLLPIEQSLAQELEANRDRTARTARDSRDRRFLEDAPTWFRQAAAGAPTPERQAELLAQLGVADLRRMASSEGAGAAREERLSAERRLYALYIQTGLYLPREFLDRRDWDRALFFLDIAAAIDPESPRIDYRKALAWAGKGDRRRALDHLCRALATGGTDQAEIEAEPAFARWREDPAWQSALDALNR